MGYFGFTPYPYQERIFKAVFKDNARKITIRAATRAGKSKALAVLAIFRAGFLKNHRVGIIAPTYDKTRIIMNYVAELLASNPVFVDDVMLETEGMTVLERLRKEVSKRRITLKDGSSIECKSVDLDSKGMGVLGWAYSTILVDESSLLSPESYAMVYRMLVENPDACIVEIGNPWHIDHFYTHHHSDDWFKMHISWKDCVDAGRMTMEDVMDQRRNLTELEFRVLFEAEFPLEVEMAIFSKECLENMQKAVPDNFRFEKYIIGVDVARSGRDHTAITSFGCIGNQAYFKDRITMDTRDIMTIVGRVAELASAYKSERYRVEVAVDSIGVGAGVFDRLRELEYDVQEFIAGSEAMNKDRFYNIKTEVACRVAEMGKSNQIHNVPMASPYVLQFRSYIYEIKSDRRIKLIDPEDKSPDEGDSALIALSRFVYHDDAVIYAPEAMNRPAWTKEKPKDLLRMKR